MKEAVERDMRTKIWILADTADRVFCVLMKINISHLFVAFPTAGRDKSFTEHFLNLNTQFKYTTKNNLWIKNFPELKHCNGSSNTTLRKWKKKFKFFIDSFVRNDIKVYEKYWLHQLQNFSKKVSLREMSFKDLNKESIEFDEEGVIKNYFNNVDDPTKNCRKQ